MAEPGNAFLYLCFHTTTATCSATPPPNVVISDTAHTAKKAASLALQIEPGKEVKDKPCSAFLYLYFHNSYP